MKSSGTWEVEIAETVASCSGDDVRATTRRLHITYSTAGTGCRARKWSDTCRKIVRLSCEYHVTSFVTLHFKSAAFARRTRRKSLHRKSTYTTVKSKDSPLKTLNYTYAAQIPCITEKSVFLHKYVLIRFLRQLLSCQIWLLFIP